MDTISHSETSLLRNFYMYEENNAPLMTKNVNFAFFPWTLLGHSKKDTDLKENTIKTKIQKKTLKSFWSLLKIFLNNKIIPLIPPLFHSNRFISVFKQKSQNI